MDKDYLRRYLAAEDWLLPEQQTQIDTQSLYEALFTLGNGYVGSRGIYEERPIKSMPGTYFAGIFDHLSAHEAIMVNAPNPFHLVVSTSATEHLAIFQTATDYNERLLDFYHGQLYRKTIFRTQDNRIDLQSLRFVSMHDLNLAIAQTVITPLEQETLLIVQADIDTNIKNQRVRADFAAFEIQEQTEQEGKQLLYIKTVDGKKHLAYAQITVIDYENTRKIIPSKSFELVVKKNETLIVTQYTVFFTSREIADHDLRHVLEEKINEVSKLSFQDHLRLHQDSFSARWQHFDIQIGSDAAIQKALRFNLYHLLIGANAEVKDVSVGAKLLSGEGYKGHVFWDTELLLFPAYLYNEPAIARQLLEYRYHRLPEAKQVTEKSGYKGVLFPWESADTGFDETPVLFEDFDGTIHHVHTGKNSLHINLAIFVAIYTYYLVTDDEEFMLDMGLAMIIEMDRFWKSRVVHNRKRDTYKLKRVMGPDEFHEFVNNNAYTNQLVSWSFKKTLELITKFSLLYPAKTQRLLHKYKFYRREMEKLQVISEKMYIPKHEDIIIQFDRFLKLRKPNTLTYDINGLPNFPSDVLVMDLFRTQYIKQPDVILLMLLLPVYFNRSVAQANFNFYDARTLHKSSWSPPIQSAVAAQIGSSDKAYHYLTLTVNTDLKNIFGNTREGVHTPAVGGSWIAVIYGMCGLRVQEDRLILMPNLPPQFSSIGFSIVYRAVRLHVLIHSSAVEIKLDPAIPAKSIRVQIGSKTLELQTGGACSILLEACSIFDTPSQEAVTA